MKLARLRRDRLNPRSADNWLALLTGIGGLILIAISFFDLPVSKATHLTLAAFVFLLFLVASFRDIRRRWRAWRDEIEL